MITKKTLKVKVAFIGSGAVVEKPKGTFKGGVATPNLRGLAFSIVTQVPDDDLVVTVLNAASIEGNFQANVWGPANAYRELGRYFLALAELDTTAHPGFHEHHELTSYDTRTRIHLIVRKRSSKKAQLPNKRLKLPGARK